MSSSGRAVIPTLENQGLSVLHLTTAKLEVIRHLANSNKVAAVLLQETHWVSDDNLKLPGFLLAGSIHSKQHGMSNFVRTGLSWSAISQSPPGSNIEWLITKIQETSVVNPPPSALTAPSLPSVTAPAIYAGDFNCQHTDWGYNHTSQDGETLSDWASNTEALLLFDPKESPSFFSARWNTYTNPDLAFAVCRSNDRKPERRVIDRCSKEEHPTWLQQELHLPKTWRHASVIALLKPNKPVEDPKAYRPILLLCVPFKILERLIHSRIDPVVDPQLPREQASFRRGRSTVDQVTLLVQDIKDSFQDNQKAGVVLLDLTAAYDTVWHRGLHLKLLRTIPDRHMVRFIMDMLSNRSFVLQTSGGQRSRLRRLKNGVPQGSVLSPMLFNIYIYDLPDTTSSKYGYADDLAIMLRRPTWKAMEDGLNRDMGILADYLRKWRLQLSVGKTVSAAYHLNNREAKRELDVFVDNKRLESQQAPKYLGVRMDRTLSYKQHLEEVKAKVTSRVLLIRRLTVVAIFLLKATCWGGWLSIRLLFSSCGIAM
ncbi:hypothetical protein SKAU_G00211980 [Synaphobranchus kaupii]|uniref:Reverse transcriptase domain-containing protein n=1 Tax=Synaphobranchus kaupii TaxID=118154 RepID=A0A9Q1F9M0_SYNKA|nr:hypothetical protein SKAU_G00211980 [Synaphobranchus kaupii]